MTRADGRGPNEIRPITLEAPFLRHAEGSASIHIGNTWVISAATVLERQPHFMKGESRGWVTAEYGMLPRAVPNRLTRGRPSGRTEEIQRMVGRSLRTTVDLPGLAMHTIVIDCDVVQADGGTRAASVTAGFVAMCLAMQWMMRDGRILRIPVRDQIAGVSFGWVNGELLCDLTHEEDSSATTDINIIGAGSGGVVGLYAAAEVEPFPADQIPRLLDVSAGGLAANFVEQRRILGLPPDRPFDAGALKV